MSEQDQTRKAELVDKIEHCGIHNISSDDISLLIKLEDEMADSKNMLVELYEKNVISNLELEEKIAKCFDVFLQKVSNRFGREFCSGLYDYLPGEELSFLSSNKNILVKQAEKISSMSANLKKLWEDLAEKYAIERSSSYPLFNLIDEVAFTSTELANGMNETFESLVEKENELQAELIDIENNLMPLYWANYVGPEFTKAVNEKRGLLVRRFPQGQMTTNVSTALTKKNALVTVYLPNARTVYVSGFGPTRRFSLNKNKGPIGTSLTSAPKPVGYNQNKGNVGTVANRLDDFRYKLASLFELKHSKS